MGCYAVQAWRCKASARISKFQQKKNSQVFVIVKPAKRGHCRMTEEQMGNWHICVQNFDTKVDAILFFPLKACIPSKILVSLQK